MYTDVSIAPVTDDIMLPLPPEKEQRLQGVCVGGWVGVGLCVGVLEYGGLCVHTCVDATPPPPLCTTLNTTTAFMHHPQPPLPATHPSPPPPPPPPPHRGTTRVLAQLCKLVPRQQTHRLHTAQQWGSRGPPKGPP